MTDYIVKISKDDEATYNVKIVGMKLLLYVWKIHSLQDKVRTCLVKIRRRTLATHTVKIIRDDETTYTVKIVGMKLLIYVWKIHSLQDKQGKQGKTVPCKN